MSVIYAISNQKGGCGKTSLTLNLGASLARMGYKVCLVDCDPQGNMTMALGYQQPDELPVTLPHIMNEIIRNGGKLDNSELIKNKEYILHAQGMDFVPSSIDLADTENVLINAISREYVLKKFINYIKGDYDYMGYTRIITYILESENGASLRASGWTYDGVCGGGGWDRPNRKRIDKAPTCKKKRYCKYL